MSTHTTADLLDIRHVDQAYFAALAASVACCRLFARRADSSWRLGAEHIDTVELLLSELAANAVQASDIAEPRPASDPVCRELRLIGVRLLDLADSLVIEVWDASPKPPILIKPSSELEHGRGLQIVNALSTRWGYYDVRTGGKVVWCQLALTTGAHERGTDDAEGFRVLEALEAHPWNGHA
jgi:Histidine kinase-like ATPase domain